jgi:hypothetical protein
MASNAEQVLSKKSLPAWQTILFLVGVAAGVLKLIEIDHKQAVAAAQEVVAPLQSSMDKHIEQTEALKPIMMRTADELRRGVDLQTRNQIRICAKLRIECETK